jgi:NAD(P)-dependent dehydrogenase (short-subunit alcohol dehydrogenase family)
MPLGTDLRARVNAVAPSLIETDMMRARRDEMAARIPLGAWASLKRSPKPF